MNHKGIISRVLSDSIAAELELAPGDRMVSVNGEALKDIIDLSFALADENIEITVEKADGIQEIYDIEKDYDEDLGIEFESAVFDGVRRCANQCIFCFVDQMPPDMRESLYVKDDDYRLSFLYGNFITLTNMGPADRKRIHQLHLSPLYVSVHTTDGPLRARMLGNRHAADIMGQLQELVTGGIDVHTQVVLCPDINDQDALKKTFNDLYDLFPHVLSMAIVPVGLTRYREQCYPLETFSCQAARSVVEMVECWQKRSRSEHGVSFVYLADEFYLRAGMPVPDYEWYDGFPQLENGIGMVRSFIAEWEKQTDCFSAYAEPHYLDVICGVSAEKVLRPLFAGIDIPNLTIRLVPVENTFFGAGVTVTGLLTGQDIINTLASLPGPRTGVIIPGVALRKGEAVFLDNKTPQDIQDELKIPVRTAFYAHDLHQLLCDWR